jgi:hypothetical protein
MRANGGGELVGEHLALARGDDAGTIGAYETGFVLRFQDLGDSCHVMLWNALRDRHNKRNLSSNGLHMSISERSRTNVHQELPPQPMAAARK